MADTSELRVLHRTLDELRAAVDAVQTRYGDISAVRRIVGDLDRMILDVADLDTLPPLPEPARPPLQPIDDTPLDASLWTDADDEGIGGYHGPGAGHAGDSHGGRGGRRFGGHPAGPLGGRPTSGPQR
jgi:hypothetical protein